MTLTSELADLQTLPLDRLKQRFWDVTRELVTPLADIAARHTTPSIERAVLLRMGFDSAEARDLTNLAIAEGWIGEGVGGRVHRYAVEHGVSRRQALAALLGRKHLADEPASAKQPDRPVLAALNPNQPLPVNALLEGLEWYRPQRRGWTWRHPKICGQETFPYRQLSVDLKRGIPLQAAEYFSGADPQPDCIITSEIASGRFEDDLRRMRMAAWHGADHIMVIRTLGQSHFDGLIEGTPEGIGGVPITRKQLRATRRALDLIEQEVGRPINFHSYVSGLAGSEMAVMFAEEGVNGAHQDCQYNILYRNINPLRAVVDAFEAKRVLAGASILQVDGAHNANSTALQAWKVLPELLVQHALNCVMSELAGMSKDLIALSTVPPTAPPAPKIALDLPYAVALRFLFDGFRFRAQQNTRYSTTNTHEAVVLHTLDTLVSRLTHTDIQSTIAPDEARWVPWHSSSVQAVAATKQVLVGLDGFSEMIQLDMAKIKPIITGIIARAVLMLQDMVAAGGYFRALETGFFVDNDLYPARAGDGIKRAADGGVGAGTVVSRSDNYLAPVCGHFGRNEGTCQRCTLCDDSLVRYIDELDEHDNVSRRREAVVAVEEQGVLPEAEHRGDGWVTASMFVPLPEPRAESAAVLLAKRMNLCDVRVIDRVVLHPAEGVQFELVGRIIEAVKVPDPPRHQRSAAPPPSAEQVRSSLIPLQLRIVGATLGDDEHSVGLQEVTNIKHQGLEWFGVTCLNIGTSVLIEQLLDEAVEQRAIAVLASLIVSHGGLHRLMMRKLHDMAVERGVRDSLLLIAGGPQITFDLARECGLDVGFGPRTTGLDVARFLLDAIGKQRRQVDRESAG